MRRRFDEEFWMRVATVAAVTAIIVSTAVIGIADCRAQRTCTAKGGVVDWHGSESWKCADLPPEDPR